MDDLISRAAAIEAIVSVTAFPDAEYIKNLCQNPANSEDWLGGVYDAINAVEEVNAVDAAPIIRCASCKWWNGSMLGVAHRCAALHIATTGEFYCAAAERKSNAFADQSGAEYADNPTV